MTSKVISWLEEILPDIKRTQDPEAVMLKFAATNNLAPALLEKLAQVYNSAKTLNFLEKSANRGASFHVVDADALIRRYTAEEKQAAASHNEWLDAAAVKSASLTTPVADRWPTEAKTPEPVLESHLPQKVASAKSVLRARSEAQATVANYRQVVFDLNEDVNDLTVKIAEAIRVLPDFDFSALEADAIALHGPGVKVACDLVSRRLMRRHFRHKRASAAGHRRLVRDRHGLVAQLQSLTEAVDMHKAATSLESEYVKAAGTLAPQAPAAPEKTLDEPKAGKPEPKPEEKKEKTDKDSGPSAKPSPAPSPAAGKGVFSTLGSIPVPQSPVEPMTMMRQLVQEALPTRNTGQQQVDRDHDDLQSQIVVERLLMTDPILADSDPHTVISLANSIREQAPHVARDINAMRFALREAVQYQALPTHSVKDLAGIEKTRVDTAGAESALAKDRYAQGLKKEPKK
jgi:hypothetical protein